ncbi:MAG: C39 family peptidase [Prochloraceae cyanobacterium]|nr:C39 family peptidase [Prochloraceae cyanobacterium]
MIAAIQSTSNTLFKRQLKDSAQLDSNDKFPIRRDTTLDLKELGDLNKSHYRIVLEEAIEGCNYTSGYVFAPHWGVLQCDDPIANSEIAKIINPAVGRQIDRLKPYLQSGISLDLNTPTRYFSQRDNYTMSHRTCNSSSNAMYLDWLLRVTGRPQLQSDDIYLKKVLEFGDTIYHGVQTSAIQEFGFRTKWMTDADLPFIEDLLDAGFPVVCNILHRGSLAAPRGGHVILLIGRKGGNFISHDPYGTLMSNYTNPDGAFSKIPREVFKIRWQGCYRILR